MKKRFCSIYILLALLTTACTSSPRNTLDNSSPPAVQTEKITSSIEEDTSLTDEEVIAIAKKHLTAEEEKTRTKDAPIVRSTSFSVEPDNDHLYRYTNEPLIHKKLYKVTFSTTDDAILGPISYYIDAKTHSIVATDYRE